ncbi:MAG TPA: S8 family serine peptidase [Pseudolabrys sp.]|nr:S8 family serine peptidase [Pseudolabrys sp.]
MDIARKRIAANRLRRTVLGGLILSGTCAGAALAAEPWDRNPIVVYPGAGLPQTAAASNALVQRAAQDGQVRVIVGLRTVLHRDGAVSAAVARQETEALANLQNTVATRVLGVNRASVVNFTFIPYMSMFVNADQANRLISDPDVASIQEDIPKPAAATATNSIPIINADKLWAINYTGSGWVVAVLDTGADKTHPMLKNKVVSEACYSTVNAKSNLSSFCPGGKASSTAAGSGVNCPVSIAECDHGTHVASIAVGTSASLNGVAKAANLIPIQVFTKITNKTTCGSSPSPCALSYSSDQALGLQHVYDLRKTYKIAAVNMSISGGKFSGNCNSSEPAIESAMTQLRSAGIATAVASGNSSYDGFIGDPACVSNAIAVGSTTADDQIASYSNHSALVKLLAPGDQINGAVPGGKYAIKSGTSMASPHVAGAFGLLKASVSTLSITDVVSALDCTGKTIARKGVAKPRIDVFDAYRRMRPPSSMAVWTFDSADDGADWNSFNQPFTVSSGYLVQWPVASGWAATAVPNCNASFDLTAQIKRLDSAGYYLNGIMVKAFLNYSKNTISGYLLEYGNDGSAAMYRMDNWNLSTNKVAKQTPLCDFTPGFTVNKNGVNQVEAIANGSTLKFYLNGKLVCAKSDTTYASGQVAAMAYIPSPTTGQWFGLDRIQIKSLETKYPSPAADDLIDPASYAPGPDGGSSVAGVTPGHARTN